MFHYTEDQDWDWWDTIIDIDADTLDHSLVNHNNESMNDKTSTLTDDSRASALSRMFTVLSNIVNEVLFDSTFLYDTFL